MRTILLASTALLFAAGSALAAGSATVTINSSVAKTCSISGATPEITLDGLTPEPGEFSTSCNFSEANINVTFTSQNGGVLNDDENVTGIYKVTYEGADETSDNMDGLGSFVVSHAAGLLPQPRPFTVELTAPLTVGGEYVDVMTIAVAPQ